MADVETGEPMRATVCPGCSCLCDDIDVVLNATGQLEFHGACQRGQAYLLARSEAPPPAYFIGSSQVTIQSAIEAASELLKRAKMPLLTGLSGMGMQHQQSALELARRLAGVVDVDANADRSRQFAFQRTGAVTATLGEVRNRAELVLFWCFDPTTSHPRLLERCRVESKRTIVVGPRDWTNGQADLFIELDPRYCDHALAVCHAIASHVSLEPEPVFETTEVSLSQWQELIQRLLAQQSVACFMGGNRPEGYPGQSCYDRLAEWVVRMNRDVRLFCLFPDQEFNGLAAEDVLTMNTGFPSAVDLSRKPPAYSFLEHATSTVLARREVDAVVLFTRAGLQCLDEPARRYLGEVPKVILMSRWEWESMEPVVMNESDVRVQVSTLADGDWARMDNVLLPVGGEAFPNSEPEPDFIQTLLRRF